MSAATSCIIDYDELMPIIYKTILNVDDTIFMKSVESIEVDLNCISCTNKSVSDAKASGGAVPLENCIIQRSVDKTKEMVSAASMFLKCSTVCTNNILRKKIGLTMSLLLKDNEFYKKNNDTWYGYDSNKFYSSGTPAGLISPHFFRALRKATPSGRTCVSFTNNSEVISTIKDTETLFDTSTQDTTCYWLVNKEGSLVVRFDTDTKKKNNTEIVQRNSTENNNSDTIIINKMYIMSQSLVPCLVTDPESPQHKLIKLFKSFMRYNPTNAVNPSAIGAISGSGGLKHKYKGKSYKIRIGKNGGKYILVDGKRKYLKS